MRLSATLSIALSLSLLAVSAARAQTPGACVHGTAEGVLDASDVRAALFTTGSLFFGNTTVSGDGYLVPKDTGHSPLFAAGVWIGGTMAGELRVAGATYSDFEFWPGPLDDGAALPNPSDCSAYDHIWVVSVSDVEHYEATGEATADLAAWPVGLGAPAVDADGDPVVPTSSDQVIDLAAGERPVIYGTQMAFWVMNDVGNEHRFSDTSPMGLEVQVLASAFASGQAALDQATFYRYRLVNRNTQPLEEARFSLYSDPDLGDAIDDYMGSDSARGMTFVYNADNSDDVYGIPPALGLDLLRSTGGTMYYNGVSGPAGIGEQMYNYMQSRWPDGTPMTEGGGGYGSGGPVTVWAYAGDPVTAQFWSERNIDGEGTTNPAGDRRHLVSSEAFTLAPGESRDFVLALVFAQGSSYLDSITRLRAADDVVQAAYDNGELFPTTVANEPGAEQPEGYTLLPAYPNPFRARAVVPFEVAEAGPVRLAVYDVLGREAAVLADGSVAAGRHEVVFDGQGLASGVYLIALETGGRREVRRVVLVR